MAKLRAEDEILKKKIKLRLAKLRNELGETKNKFSQSVDVERQNFQPWENLDNKRGISIYSLNRICKGLNISLKDFFDDPMFYENEL